MKTRILRTVSLAIAAAMLLMCLPALAESSFDGQMSITVGNAKSDFDRSGIQFAAYLIARGEYGVWTPVKEFENIKITARDDGSAWIDQSMKQLRQRIVDLRMKPTQTATTHLDGKANFSGLEHGIYYINVIKYSDGNLRVSPMLLSTPNKEQEVRISANAKYEYNAQPTPEEDEDNPPEEGEHHRPHVPQIIVPTRRGERLVSIDEYETALGLGNIQIHVGVCFE